MQDNHQVSLQLKKQNITKANENTNVWKLLQNEDKL